MTHKHGKISKNNLSWNVFFLFLFFFVNQSLEKCFKFVPTRAYIFLWFIHFLMDSWLTKWYNEETQMPQPSGWLLLGRNTHTHTYCSETLQEKYTRQHRENRGNRNKLNATQLVPVIKSYVFSFLSAETELKPKGKLHCCSVEYC